MNPIGIMQGRLVPPVDGRLQTFPADRWADEFTLAAQAGLDRIEWIYALATVEANPLWSPDGLQRVRDLAGASGVAVRSVCADCFMEEPLIVGGRPSRPAVERLEWLVARCAALDVEYLVLPFVDQSALQGRTDVDALTALLRELVDGRGWPGVALHLETSLSPGEGRALLATIDHPLVRATWDIGNSASLGFDASEEIAAIGPWVGSVHVKDRRRGGGSVALGTGGADLQTCFDQLAGLTYGGPFILQAARGASGEEVSLARANRALVARLWGAALGRTADARR